jgi:15-hydroxyprostaglandin dehydrogenase (NAD)
MEIQGKTAVVTGGGSGIGRTTALTLAAKGANVVVADIDDATAKETVTLLRDAGGIAEAVTVDVTDVDQVEAMFDATEAAFGGVDILHNNAGIVCGQPLWPETSAARLLQQLSVNLGAVIIGTRLAVDRMGPRGGGVIVNTGSVASLLPMPDEPVYSASKAGVLMFTRACAGLYGSHRIRVNAVLPGLVETPLLDKSGDGSTRAEWTQIAQAIMPLLQPEEVAAAVVEFVENDDLAGDYRIVGELPDFVREMI